MVKIESLEAALAFVATKEKESETWLWMMRTICEGLIDMGRLHGALDLAETMPLKRGATKKVYEYLVRFIHKAASNHMNTIPKEIRPNTRLLLEVDGRLPKIPSRREKPRKPDISYYIDKSKSNY